MYQATVPLNGPLLCMLWVAAEELVQRKCSLRKRSNDSAVVKNVF